MGFPIGGPGIPYGRITFTRRAGADAAQVLAQWSSQAMDGDNPPFSFQRIHVTPHANGTVLESWRGMTPLTQQSAVYFRLKILSLP